MKYPNISYFHLKWGYKKWAIERWFQTELIWILRGLWNIVFHPQDVWLASKFLDVHFITKQWIWFWLELKQIKWDTFNVKKFEEDQVLFLREMDKRNPELARVWIYSVKNNDYKILTFSEIWNNQNEKGWVKIFNKK